MNPVRGERFALDDIIYMEVSIMGNKNEATAVAKHTIDDVVVLRGVSLEEQETTVQISRTEDVAYVWTNDNTMVTKIRKLMGRAPDQWRLVKISTNAAGEPAGYFFECPKKCVHLVVPRSQEISDEERERRAAVLKERFAKAKANKQVDK